MTYIERLDLVARTLPVSAGIWTQRLGMLFAAVLLVWIAYTAEASHQEMFLIRVLADVAVIATVLVWLLPRRYSLYGVSLLVVAYTIITLILEPLRSPYFWVALYIAVAYFDFARRYAIVTREDWRGERDLVNTWISIIESSDRLDVFELKANSFWTGYSTYRIHNPGECWVVARFNKKGTRLQDCRVHELSDVVFRRLPIGRWNIEVTTKGKKRIFRDVDLFPSSPLIPEACIRP